MGGRSSKPPTPTSTSTPTISPTITIPDKSPHVVRSVNQSTTRHSMSQGMRSRSDRVASMNIQSSLFHSDDDSFDADDPLSTTSSHHDDTPHLPHLHPSHSNLKRISRRSSSFANCRNCNAVCIPRVVCHARHVYCGGDCYWSYTIRHESDQPHPVPRHNNTFADATPISQVLGDDSHVDGNVPVDVTDRWASKPEAVVQPVVDGASTLATSSTSSSSSLRIHPQRHHRRTLSKKTDLNTIHSASPAPPVGTSPSLPPSSTSSSHLHIHPIVHDDESSDKSPQHTPHDDDMMMDHPSTSIHHDTTQHNTPEHEMNDETYDHFDPVSLSRTSAKMRHSISYQMMQPHNTSHQRRHSELVKSTSRPILIPTPTKPQPSPYLYVRT